jgi:hypothetical protein
MAISPGSFYMLKAVDLLRQGKHEELWQMCCGYLKLDIQQFMDIQKRLLLEQLELLNHSPLGKKIMHGTRPQTIKEFRKRVPLTTYADYCPELIEKREDILPEKPLLWAHSSGWSGDYPYKWVPITKDYARNLSVALYGIGMLSCCDRWGDTSHIPNKVKILYSVAPRPYISGTFAEVLRMQTPITYMPTIEESESLVFEERIKHGFEQSVSKGLDYFFGLSLVLASVGDKFLQSSDNINLRPYLKKPKALWRLARGKLKSRLANRPLIPRDIWSLKGIIGSGVDSGVYKNKIKELWGRYPLDLYSCTEGGVIATQAWDYNGMTFIPNMNFLEFLPEEEQLKLQMDPSYKPMTLLLDEVEAEKNYEIIITNFHGGVLMRYRIGDMVKIQSLHNERLGINLPQMNFERRVDDYIDFYVVRLTEKSIWQAIENTGFAYEDWIAYKDPGKQVVNILLELKEDYQVDKEQIAILIYRELTKPDNDKPTEITSDNSLMDMMDFGIKVNLLPKGTFQRYIARKQAEGADLAHLKPPHINPTEEILTTLIGETEETIIVTKTGIRRSEKPNADEVSVI